MPGNDKGRLTPFASWVGRELLPPVTRWIEVELVPLEARALQARASRALSIGEINEHVHSVIMMRTSALLRWCWAAGKGFGPSAWIEPDGTVNETGLGGHMEWIRQNAQRLTAEGLAPQGQAELAIGPVSMKMMESGWVRYSSGVVAAFPMLNEAQIAALDGLVKQANPPPEAMVTFYIEGPEIRGEVPAQEVAQKGVAAVLADISQNKGTGGAVTASEHRADSGASDGPFQQGDGQEIQNSYMEQLQDGSTAPIEKAVDYLKQDWEPEVWWSQQLKRYLDKNYPGQPVPGAQSDAGGISEGSGPGQQFASAARVVVTAASEAARREDALLRRADATDPSDTDGQHDQLNEDSMATHALNPEEQFNKGPKGLGAPTQEVKTRLGERWRQRHSDKGVEKQIIQMEKSHLEPNEITQELREDGVSPKVIDETYQNREKNLFKVVEVVS